MGADPNAQPAGMDPQQAPPAYGPAPVPSPQPVFHQQATYNGVPIQPQQQPMPMPMPMPGQQYMAVGGQPMPMPAPVHPDGSPMMMQQGVYMQPGVFAPAQPQVVMMAPQHPQPVVGGGETPIVINYTPTQQQQAEQRQEPSSSWIACACGACMSRLCCCTVM